MRKLSFSIFFLLLSVATFAQKFEQKTIQIKHELLEEVIIETVMDSLSYIETPPHYDCQIDSLGNIVTVFVQAKIAYSVVSMKKVTTIKYEPVIDERKINVINEKQIQFINCK